MVPPRLSGNSFSGIRITMRIVLMYMWVNEHLCKIWLEPIVELAKQGDLTDVQTKEVLAIASEYRDKLLRQWSLFKEGKRVRMITVKKTKKN